MRKILLVVSLLSITAFTAAFAQAQHSGTDAEQKACSRDVTKFCRSMMDQGDLVILSCLQQNRPKISPACNQVLVSHGQ
jgi:hypothetical protein